MSKLLTIGVLDTAVTTPDYLRRFYSWGYPDKITPGKRLAKYDIVVIPDGISSYVGLQCYSGGYEPIGLAPMDNMAELFRTHERGLRYYAEHSLLIGVGDGAIMLWDFLGYKAAIIGPKAEVKLIKPDDVKFDHLKTDGLFVEEWQINNFVGVPELWAQSLTKILKEEHAKVADFVEDVKAHNKPVRLNLRVK